MEALLEAVSAHSPVAMHFTGHGLPGTLLFEDLAVRSVPVSVRELVARIRGARLPRLAFLASCYSASLSRAGEAPGTHRMVDPAVLQGDPAFSSAAELHREGIHQIVAWMGPVGDAQCTRAEESFYAALVRGRTAREAVREARQRCRLPLPERDTPTHRYPLGWAQLVLYHRGGDVPTALPATSTGPDLGRAERERITERLDRSRGPVRVERLKFGFVGRRTARARVLQRFQAGCRALVIHGMGGLGKTALCAELAPILARELGGKDGEGRPRPVRIVALDGRFAGEQREPVRALWEQVQAFGQGEAWDETLAALQREGLTGAAVVGALVWLARQEGGLLVYLDDAESLQVQPGAAGLAAWKDPGIEAFWRALIEATEKGARLAVLASTRYVPAKVSKEVVHPLGVMRQIDLIRMIPWWPAFRGLGAENKEWLAERVEGHARSLQWLDGLASQLMEKNSPPGGTFKGDLRSQVLEPLIPERDKKLREDLLLPRLLEAVGEEARRHLRRCAVLEAPAPWGAIQASEDKEGTGGHLVRAGLLSAFESPRGGDPLWAPHHVVADAAGRPEGDEARDSHQRLGRWFKAQWEKDRSQLGLAERAARHLCLGGEGDEAWKPTREVVLPLRTVGRYREALARMESVLDAGAGGAQRGKALVFRVQLKRACGVLPPEAEEWLKEAASLVDEEAQSFVLDELGGLFRHQGRLVEAADALTRSIALESRLKGEEHLNVAASLHALAGVLVVQGKFKEAQEKLERALRIYAKVFDSEEHPEVAASLQVLAGVFREQGDLAGARRMLERALHIYDKVFHAMDHPDVAATLQSLAGVLRLQGNPARAREMLERALHICINVFNTEEHPEVALVMYELAADLFAQGNLAGAREMLERTLRIYAKVFGTEEHPDVAAALHELAGVLRDQGDLAGAREKLERAIHIKSA